jgi:hypothetical protein
MITEDWLDPPGRRFSLMCGDILADKAPFGMRFCGHGDEGWIDLAGQLWVSPTVLDS